MAKKDVYLGWDGNCKDHREQPSISRPTKGTVLLEHKSCMRPIVAGILEIHCATGHTYLAINKDEWIHDPFDAVEEAEILREIAKENKDGGS
jgi:hypothetical protein